MQLKPRLLDLFCGSGGCSVGYARAGFEVVGVDIEPQPRYPFEFHQDNAMTFPLDGFDVIHASPPCQHFTKYSNRVKDIKSRYENLLEPIRTRLEKSGVLWVIENVERSPLNNPIKLCGSMFEGIGTFGIQRHRLFESNAALMPGWCNHSVWGKTYRFPGGRSIERGGSKVLCRRTMEIGKWSIPLAEQQRAMGIDWMKLRELSEAIPPAYTEYIGKQLLAHGL